MLTSTILRRYEDTILAFLGEYIEQDAYRLTLRLLELFGHSPDSLAIFVLKYSGHLKLLLKKRMSEMKPVDLIQWMVNLKVRIPEELTKISQKKELTGHFISKVDKAFEEFVVEEKVEKIFAKFLDSKMKRVVQMSEQERIDLYETIHVILKMVKNPMAFEIHYREYLRKRLLKIQNYDIFLYEGKVLELLKMYLDNEQIHYMELAIVDIKNSISLQGKFRRNSEVSSTTTCRRRRSSDRPSKSTIWDR